MRNVPFTVEADLDLGTRVTPYLTDISPDVTIREGAVPEKLDDVQSGGVSYSINKNQFLFELPNGIRFLVDRGETIIYERSGHCDRDVALFLLGSVWGALCYQRSLLPLHASAIIQGSMIHAFTGTSGAGKSTLVAALAKRGRGFFTDDVLIIDPSEIGDHALCYAGQKDLKLWEDSFKLVEVDKLSPVRSEVDFNKFYARPDNVDLCTVGHLKTLSILKNEGVRLNKEPLSINEVRGSDALRLLRESVYRPKFATAIWGLPKYYEVLAKLISSIKIQKFDRPLEKPAFDSSTAFIDNWITNFNPDGLN